MGRKKEQRCIFLDRKQARKNRSEVSEDLGKWNESSWRCFRGLRSRKILFLERTCITRGVYSYGRYCRFRRRNLIFYENGEKESGKAASHHHAHDWISFDDSMSVSHREGSLLRTFSSHGRTREGRKLIFYFPGGSEYLGQRPDE